MLKNLFSRSLQRISQRTMKIVPIPVLQDNYQYLLIDNNGTKSAAIVDPVDIDALKKTMAKEESIKLIAGFVTHHHLDHSAASGKLVEAFSGDIHVYGNDEDRIEGQSKATTHGDSFNMGDLKVTTYHTPCHTTTHVCYYVEDKKSNERAVFTGDTLFIGGCGRFFEGTPQQMDEALNQILGALPDDTKVYCGHEYTVQNLKFAKTVDSKNEILNEKLEWAKKQREANHYTVPSTIGDEKKFNPFMRVREPALMAAAKSKDPIETMQALREMKNKM